MPVFSVATKRCPECRRDLAFVEFYADGSHRDGLSTRCRWCTNSRAKRWYAENRVRKQRFCHCGRETRSPKSRYCEEHALEALNRRILRRSRRKMTPAQLEKARARELERSRDPVRRAEHADRYGWSYQQERSAWKGRVDTGMVRCGRAGDCFYAEIVAGGRVGGRIRPGQAWDLGHDEVNGRVRGPEHRRCNRATAKWKAKRSGGSKKPKISFRSREW